MISSVLAAALLSFSPAHGANEVPWFQGPFSAALEKARAEGKQIFAYFWMDSSEYCVRVYGETINTESAAGELNDFVCFSVNATQPEGGELIQRYNVTTLPTMLVLSPDGQVDDAILGFIPLNSFVTEIQRIKQGTQTVGAMRAAAEASPENLDLRLTLAMKLDFVGDKEGSEALMDSIRRVDPRGRTLAGAQLALYDVRQKIIGNATNPNDQTTFDLTPAYRHLPGVKQGSVAFTGWDWVAQIENARGDRPKARKAFMAAWPHIPEASIFAWATEVVRGYWENRDELSRRDKKFALEVAQAAEAQAESRLETVGGAEENLDDEGRNVVAVSYSLLASSYFMNGQRAKALEAIDRSIQIEPENEGSKRLRAQFEK